MHQLYFKLCSDVFENIFIVLYRRLFIFDRSVYFFVKVLALVKVWTSTYLLQLA